MQLLSLIGIGSIQISAVTWTPIYRCMHPNFAFNLVTYFCRADFPECTANAICHTRSLAWCPSHGFFLSTSRSFSLYILCANYPIAPPSRLQSTVNFALGIPWSQCVSFSVSHISQRMPWPIEDIIRSCICIHVMQRMTVEGSTTNGIIKMTTMCSEPSLMAIVLRLAYMKNVERFSYFSCNLHGMETMCSHKATSGWRQLSSC